MARPEQVYARSIYQYSGGGSNAGLVVADLQSFWALCNESKVLMAAVTRPGVSAAGRAGTIEELSSKMGLGALSARVLLVLSRASRISLVPALIEELRRLIDRAENLSSGTLVAAVELSQEELLGLSSALAKRVGSRVRLEQRVDASLLGGFVATVDGKTYDASLRGQLTRFKKELI